MCNIFHSNSKNTQYEYTIATLQIHISLIPRLVYKKVRVTKLYKPGMTSLRAKMKPSDIEFSEKDIGFVVGTGHHSMRFFLIMR